MAYKEIVARIAGNTFIEKKVTTSPRVRPFVKRFVAGQTRGAGAFYGRAFE